MTRYHVDADALLSATSTTTATIGRLQAECAGLTSQLSALQGSWSGNAATAFQALVAEWMATYSRLEQNLAALNHALGQAGRQYAEIEQQAASMFLR
ncbi:MAG: WXG100 family type VII secretion target [Microcella sp.]